MYSAPQTSLDTGMPAQQLHSMTSPTSLTPNMNSMKDGGYHENVDQISPSPSHYSVPHSLRKYVLSSTRLLLLTMSRFFVSHKMNMKYFY